MNQPLGFSGLNNLGNTCYLNATLQILSHIHTLNNYLTQNTLYNDTIDKVLTIEWISLYNLMWSQNCTISPNRFVHFVKQISRDKNSILNINEQNDAIEYFYFVIDTIHNSLNKTNDIKLKKTKNKNINKAIDHYEKDNSSIIHYLFTSFIMNKYTNRETGQSEFDKTEPSFTVELSIPNIENIDLNACFEHTFQSEELTDLWFDDKTKEHKKLTKQTYLCYLPEILVIHLKRWNHNLKKKECIIRFEDTINIHKYTIDNNLDECNYELFGIINHTGNVFGGHYYSYIKKTDKWFRFDDSTIQNINSSVVNDKNYCLFYKKIN